MEMANDDKTGQGQSIASSQFVKKEEPTASGSKFVNTQQDQKSAAGKTEEGKGEKDTGEKGKGDQGKGSQGGQGKMGAGAALTPGGPSASSGAKKGEESKFAKDLRSEMAPSPGTAPAQKPTTTPQQQMKPPEPTAKPATPPKPKGPDH
jgi:hypothetical protein